MTECSNCGETSENCYRCSECGHDLVDDQGTGDGASPYRGADA